MIRSGAGVVDAEWQTVIDVMECSICHGPTFARYGWLDPWFDSPEDARDYTVLYPRQHEVADLPNRVALRYSQMLELLFAPDAFAVRAGRVLEAVCSDQGFKKGDLNDRLNDLANSGALPHALADQAHLVRKYRNLGGHDADLEVEEADLGLIRDFVEALLEFLYWGPAKLARGNAQLRSRLSAAKGT